MTNFLPSFMIIGVFLWLWLLGPTLALMKGVGVYKFTPFLAGWDMNGACWESNGSAAAGWDKNGAAIGAYVGAAIGPFFALLVGICAFVALLPPLALWSCCLTLKYDTICYIYIYMLHIT